MTISCLYEGTIRRRRHAPPSEFEHRLTLAYIDLDELPELLGDRLLARPPGALRFRRRDYLGERSVPLDQAVRERVASITGAVPAGPIRVLTGLRSWGLCFNPVSFYYCHESADGPVASVVAEVTNTPWGEGCSYILRNDTEGSSILRGTFAQELHVSPFMGMDHTYEARATEPPDTLSVQIESHRQGETVFEATLGMRRRALDRAFAARLSARYPLAAVRVLALICGHALGLKLAGAQVHRHPHSGTV